MWLLISVTLYTPESASSTMRPSGCRTVPRFPLICALSSLPDRASRSIAAQPSLADAQAPSVNALLLAVRLRLPVHGPLGGAQLPPAYPAEATMPNPA